MAEKKMTKAQVLAKVKENVIGNFAEILEQMGAEQVGDFAYAIPTEVDGVEKWARFDLTAKDSMTDDNGDKVAYDPFIEQARWQFDREVKAKAKAERDRKHAETVAKAEKKRALAKEKAMLKKAEREKAESESAE